MGMIAENFASNDISFPDDEHISEPCASWCKIFLKERSPLQFKSSHKKTKQSFSTLPWEIRKTSSDFKAWLRERNSYAFYFDGASKGNLGVAGVGGDPSRS